MPALKTIFAFLLVSLCSTFMQVRAQSTAGNHTVFLGTGLISIEPLKDVSNILTFEAAKLYATAPSPSVLNLRYSPVFSAGYKYYLEDGIRIGGTAGFEKSTGEVWQEDVKTGTFSRNSVSVAAEGAFVYLQKNKLSMYATGGIGYTFNSLTGEGRQENLKDTFGQNHFTAYFSPVGVRFGNKLGISLEAGYGYKGVLNIALDYRFK